MTDAAPTTPADTRISRLSTASVRRLVEPDHDVVGDLTQDQVIPDELLSVAGLGLDLSPEQRARLSREEVASILRNGIEFECVLMCGFAYHLMLEEDLTDPRFAYGLHEIGEETRHSRLFARVHTQLGPRHRPVTHHPALKALNARSVAWLYRRRATFDTFVLGGEEIPDLLLRLSAEHPATDPYLAAVNRYHRMEEARHLAFARTVVGEHRRRSRLGDRLGLAVVAPKGIAAMFDLMVDPSVYATVGLPRWRTWWRVTHSPARIRLRQQALRAVLDALLDAGALRPGRVPRAWRAACGVDRRGVPTD